MKAAVFLVLLVATLGSILAASTTAQAQAGEIRILHSPPPSPMPGFQIHLTAVLVNATSASVAWSNGTAEGIVPMTNLSEARDGGWAYRAWLPAQPDGTQVSYSIRATDGTTEAEESFFLTVTAPGVADLTPEQQAAWVLSLVASMTLAASPVALLYWYTGRRLRREGA